MKFLRNIAFRGIPCTTIQEFKVDGCTSMLRPLVWRILLNVLPLDVADWEISQKTNLDTYELWKSELIPSVDRVRKIYETDGNVLNFDEEYEIAA